MEACKLDFKSSEKLLTPKDRSLLTMQDSHVTRLIWRGGTRECIRPNDHSLSVTAWHLSPAQQKLINSSGFSGLSATGYVLINSHLITSVLDRWRPETNTFHFPFGEMTITLEDVAYILGLPVSGKVVSGTFPENPREFVQKMLGQAPKVGSDDLCGNRIRLTWIRKKFANTKNPNNEAHNLHVSRAYILNLLGSTIFSDTGTGYVPIMYLSLLDKLDEASGYAWGAAALAYLYRAMTKAVIVTNEEVPINLCGSFTLLMCWIYEHIPIGRPTYRPDKRNLFPLARKWNHAHAPDTGRQPYICLRPALDKLQTEDVLFQPYLKVHKAPKFASRASSVACVDLVLNVFHVIAPYNGSRCMQQYGKVQHIPRSPIEIDVCLYSSRHSRKKNYTQIYSNHVMVWDAYVSTPDRFIIVAENIKPGRTTHPDYRSWYAARSIRRVEPYTFEEIHWIKDTQELKQAAAEYALLSKPYLQDAMIDPNSRLSELFGLLAPLNGYRGTQAVSNDAGNSYTTDINKDDASPGTENDNVRVPRLDPSSSEKLQGNRDSSHKQSSQHTRQKDGNNRTPSGAQSACDYSERSAQETTMGCTNELHQQFQRKNDQTFNIRSLLSKSQANLFPNKAKSSTNTTLETSPAGAVIHNNNSTMKDPDLTNNHEAQEVIRVGLNKRSVNKMSGNQVSSDIGRHDCGKQGGHNQADKYQGTTDENTTSVTGRLTPQAHRSLKLCRDIMEVEDSGVAITYRKSKRGRFVG